MREIKFRAWNGIKMSNSATLEHLVDLDFPYNQDNIIWLQYTGLKDKNGVEIYEGDVVKIVNVNWEVIWNEYEIGWTLMPRSENGFTFDAAHEVFCSDLETDSNQRSEVEVVGTIQENPELLEN